MIHFSFLESAGLKLAIMTNRSDGDCGLCSEGRQHTEALLDRLPHCPERLLRLKQVHGRTVLNANAIVSTESAPEADGLVTNQPGQALCINVADCAPVLLHDPERGITAALHAGRQGTLLDIARAGVTAMMDNYGSVAQDIRALIGPCAGPCCYEVSPTLAADWRAAGLPATGRHLDIGAANWVQLENAGVIRHNIQVVSHCTVCGGEFFSYRAEKTSSRNLVLVMS